LHPPPLEFATYRYDEDKFVPDFFMVLEFCAIFTHMSARFSHPHRRKIAVPVSPNWKPTGVHSCPLMSGTMP
jgi:hypothetical protein